MPSTFTWLDYSEHERRKMLDVIQLFGQRETRDELGLGGVRDAFADLLFPGTSTVQTLAKYFLLVPWVYLSMEQKRVRTADVALRARKLEIELARVLIQSNESDGVIGRLAKERLQRLPSSIYWQGLFQWGIRVFSGSQDEYHRSLDLFYDRQQAGRSSRHEYEGEAVEEPELHNWHLGLPQPKEGFPNGVTLTLHPHEAEYLRERLLTNCPKSLMAWLVREGIDVNGLPFVWHLPVELPETLRLQVRHGRNFSEVMHGAQLLYNLMLAEQRAWQEKLDVYRDRFDEWWELIQQRHAELVSWNQLEFWRIVSQVNPRITPAARRFIDDWIGLVTSASDRMTIVEGADARGLVEQREGQLKGGLARLRNDQACKLWNGAAGAAQLDLRWNSARRIISDILSGLEVTADA